MNLLSQDLMRNLSAKRLLLFFGAFVFFACYAFLIHINYVLLADPDTWWHIKTGQDILTSRHLPIVDSYSYTFAGQPWIAKEWLSQVLFALSYNIAGWNGVVWLAAFAIACALTALYFEIARSLNPPLAVVATIFITLFTVPVFVARPHIFTFVVAIIFASRLWRAAYDQRAPEFWLLLLVTLWTNLHGSFTLAFIIAGFTFFAMVENNRLKDWSVTGRWVLFLVLCPVASFINPYGLQPLLINFGFVSGLPVMASINEWQPLNAANAPIVEFGLLAFTGILLSSGARLSITKTLFVLLTLHMMLTHFRFVYVYFLLVPIIVSREISSYNEKFSTAKWAMKTRDAFELLIARYVMPITAFGVIATLGLFWQGVPYSPPPERKIEGALAYIRDHHLTGPVLNSYDVGGPLILNNIKTFIDGRSEQLFYGDFFTNDDVSGKVGGEAALADILQKYDIKWAILVPPDLRKDFIAKMPNWKKTYSDDYAFIFERN
jgi:hypothetical protein